MRSQQETLIRRAEAALAFVVAALVGVFAYPLSGLLGLAGVAFGCYLFARAKLRPAYHSNAPAKLVLAGSLTVLLFFLPVAAPSVLTTHIALNESSAVEAMRSISRAEQKFRTILDSARYATLDELVDARLIDEHLAGGTMGGYRFLLRLNGSGFEAFAVPLKYGRYFGTGQRSFYVDQSGQLREADGNGGDASADGDLVDLMRRG